MTVASPKENILILSADLVSNALLGEILSRAGYAVTVCVDEKSLPASFKDHPPVLVICNEEMNHIGGAELIHQVSQLSPATPCVLLSNHPTVDLLAGAMSAGCSGVISRPFLDDSILKTIRTALERSRQQQDWLLANSRRVTSNLKRKVDEMEALARIGRSVTGSLNLDNVLTAVVDAAVELTGAEEGSLLLLDEENSDLYMRAARNLNEDLVRTLRIPVTDNLPGQVLQSGKPYILEPGAPQKIVTSYLVKSLIYVPIQTQDRTYGLLGVDNQVNEAAFKERDIKLLSTLAEYAVIALENARLYASIHTECNKLETILNRIEDGVLVVDPDMQLMLVNHAAQSILDIENEDFLGRKLQDVINQPDIQELFERSGKGEVSLDNGQIFSACLSPVPDVGLAMTLHDITTLKKLDRIKSDFVSTVSHDLRSPLTAILGYVDLIERAGPVNDLQKDFIRRVITSVHNITGLVDDLLNLGRVEAGFDARKETVSLLEIIKGLNESYQKTTADRGQKFIQDLPAELPPVFGNAVHIRQMVDNLLGNASKYTPTGGVVAIHCRAEQKQIILEFSDTGIGIPAVDLPHIFEKFYRASNTDQETPGTGLGLAIVKSIVESHEGRIWVDSYLGKGTKFTVVLPVANSVL